MKKILLKLLKNCLGYLIIGTITGSLIFYFVVVATTSADISDLGKVKSFKDGVKNVLEFYTFTLLLGGGPSIITGAIMSVEKWVSGRPSEALFVGFLVTSIFYFFLISGASFLLGIVGAIAAAVSSFLINAIECSRTVTRCKKWAASM